ASHQCSIFSAYLILLICPVKNGGITNVDQAPVLTTKYEIWGLPSVLIFHEGQLVKRIPGVKPASVYAQAIADIKKGQ
ncbi:thioredoxin family protein, partial [Enterobacter hormaechei]|uniref:thioredoxin family protein n=1 Tax=Enterobacter hormaechei TaxID=158836 RepID=UPI0032DAF8E1